MTRRPRSRGTGPRDRRRSRGRALVTTLGLLTTFLLAWCGWFYAGPGPAPAAGVDVVLPSGGGLNGVSQSLTDSGAVRSRLGFMVAAVITGAAHRLKAGEYAFHPRESLADVLRAIVRGEVVRHFVTIPEGFTSEEATAVLRRASFLSGPAQTPAEGSLLPETYEVRRGESRQGVLRRMAAARDRVLDHAWSTRAPGLPYASREQAVILASVVEKETARPDERPRIAAVFINRLRKGMRLESDPTVIYGVSRGVPLGHGLRASELAGRTPYNTYLVAGLPPTPIANPGRAALEAALSPARTDDLYFVADGTGGHVFASTFEAHLRNVARWRAIEQSGRRATEPAA